MQAPYLIRILVIDEIPLISVGLQEVFRSIHPDIRVEYTDSVFRALSSREYENNRFHLVINTRELSRARHFYTLVLCCDCGLLN